MTTVLVTGATGTLGRLFLPHPLAAPYQVRAMSRRAITQVARSAHDPAVTWCRADIVTGDGVDAVSIGDEVFGFAISGGSASGVVASPWARSACVTAATTPAGLRPPSGAAAFDEKQEPRAMAPRGGHPHF